MILMSFVKKLKKSLRRSLFLRSKLMLLLSFCTLNFDPDLLHSYEIIISFKLMCNGK